MARQMRPSIMLAQSSMCTPPREEDAGRAGVVVVEPTYGVRGGFQASLTAMCHGATPMTKTTAGLNIVSPACPDAPCGAVRSTIGAYARADAPHSAALGRRGVDEVDSDKGGGVATVAQATVATRVLLGSADPHGLGWCERQAPLMCRPTIGRKSSSTGPVWPVIPR